MSKVEIEFPDDRSATKFLRWLDSADWSVLVDEDFYFEWDAEILRNIKTVVFNKSRYYEQDDIED